MSKFTIEEVCAVLNGVLMQIAEEGKDIECQVRYDAEKDEFRLEISDITPPLYKNW